VINAKSGWGKSSLALRLQQQVEKVGGVAMVIDSRTAERTDFVPAAIERVVRHAVQKGVLEPAPNSAGLVMWDSRVGGILRA